ncbi:MAG: HAMP domain-containing sensor histidine kinase [Pseudomonadota bacterium]
MRSILAKKKLLYGPLVAAVVAIFGFQFFVLNQMMDKTQKHKDDLGNTLWIASELQAEHLRLLNVLDQYANGDFETTNDVLQRRLDIFISRLPLFLEGAHGDLFGQVPGAHSTVLALQGVIDRLEPRIRNLERNNHAAYRVIRRELDHHGGAIRSLVLNTFLADEAVTEEILEESERAYWLLLAGALGVFASGAALIVFLIWQVRRAERAEVQARRESDRAIRADRTKSEFLANISHEIRTPLNAVVGFSESMKMELWGPLGNARYRNYVDDIHSSAMLLVRLIGDILDVSKIEAGKYELKEESADMAHLALMSIRMFRQQARSQELDLSVQMPDGPLRIYGDPRVLQQVVINLLSNAVKFTPAGGRVSLSLTQSRKGSVVLSVADTGIGISKSDLDIALAPFGQVANVMTRGHSGTGLGLPLAKSLVELHDGVMTIDTRPNKGTKVTVTFPPDRSAGTALAA